MKTENEQIIENQGLVISIAKGFPMREIDDYIQVGRIGLLKAIRTYNGLKGKFSTYAYVCIKNEMLREYNKNKKHSKIINMNQFDNIQSPVPVTINTDDLNAEEKIIVEMRLNHSSYRDIAKELGCSRNKIRKMLKEMGPKI